MWQYKILFKNNVIYKQWRSVPVNSGGTKDQEEDVRGSRRGGVRKDGVGVREGRKIVRVKLWLLFFILQNNAG
jgi:hypothetical protein